MHGIDWQLKLVQALRIPSSLFSQYSRNAFQNLHRTFAENTGIAGENAAKPPNPHELLRKTFCECRSSIATHHLARNYCVSSTLQYSNPTHIPCKIAFEDKRILHTIFCKKMQERTGITLQQLIPTQLREKN